MINEELNKNLENKLDYKYELSHKSIVRSNMDDLLEKQQNGFLYGIIPGIIVGLVSSKYFKYSFKKSIFGCIFTQYLFFTIYSFRQKQIYEGVTHKINSKISEDINIMTNLN